ncbi:hypothetical protein BR93DRAFT_977431 [Coniochaeta sp. PMI_546]|nr:hypothetical protein BR93DRAFT_977431 [Coniochaeta sp. PMI_546]
MSVLFSNKQQSSSHSHLAQDWDFPNDYMLPMAYIFRDPSDLVWLFYERIYPRLYTDPADQAVSKFFQLPGNKELLASVERRLRVSEQYTQYLKDNNLLDDDEDEPEWQQLREWTADARKTLEKLRQWSDETQEELKRMDEKRAMQRGPGQHLQGVSTLLSLGSLYEVQGSKLGLIPGYPIAKNHAISKAMATTTPRRGHGEPI